MTADELLEEMAEGYRNGVGIFFPVEEGIRAALRVLVERTGRKRATTKLKREAWERRLAEAILAITEVSDE